MPTTAISKTRRQVYKDWCDAVDAARNKGGEAFIELGFDLKGLKESGAWQEEFESFESCVQTKWAYTAQHANRLIRVCEFEHGCSIPSQLRVINTLNVLCRIDGDKHDVSKVCRDIVRDAKKQLVSPNVEFVDSYLRRKKVLPKIKRRKRPSGSKPLEDVYNEWSRKIGILCREMEYVRKAAGSRSYMRPFIAQRQRLSNALAELNQEVERFGSHLPAPSTDL